MDAVRVLIVDDQKPFRDAAAGVVESMDGFTVVATAETAEEALTVARPEAVDLVLMDVMLPGMSGLQAASLLTRRDGAPMVVLVSTYDATEFGSDVAASGAAAYLSKSAFGPDELRAVWAGQRT